MNLEKLFQDVFHIEPGERVLVLTDHPHGALRDSPIWQDRRRMAGEWREAFAGLGRRSGFEVLPLVSYPATGQNNGDLPLAAIVDRGRTLDAVLGDATLAVALTEFSPSAPLSMRSLAAQDFRAATLPGVERRMEQTALAADYAEVARRCRILAAYLCDARSADVVFATGHRCRFDLRHREPDLDDGQMPRDRPGVRLINLPSGEVCMNPYEGEIPGDDSETGGELPVSLDGEVLAFIVERNRIVDVRGPEPAATRWRAFFAEDRARANIAEFAFGCNPRAAVTGNVLEDEKAGFHWAYGRSEHLGGTVSAASFASPEHVVHQDIVYAKGSPIELTSVHLNRANGSRPQIIGAGEYRVF
jgi:hypothetical protein